MIGDFNEVLNSSEKVGGSQVSCSRCLRFASMISSFSWITNLAHTYYANMGDRPGLRE